METSDANQSPSLAALAAALAKAQGQMSNARKDATNPHFKSKYADLAAIWDACREPLATNGLAVMQRVSSRANGSVSVTTMLAHSSGEWVKDECTFPVAQNTPQGYGSAITYARRYSLAALVGVAADDDDGNAASTPAPDSGRSSAPTSTSAKDSKPKAKPVVDVKPGETEAQASARTATEAKPGEPSAYEQMEIACDELKLARSCLGPMIKALMDKGTISNKKAKKADLDASDLAAVKAELAKASVAAAKVQEALNPPPHTDEDSVPF